MAARPVFNATLGEYFAELRLAHNWTQRQATAIAFNRKIAGISKQTIWRIEKGKIKHPEADALRGLAALYGVSYEELVVRCVEAQYGVKLVPATAAERKSLPRPNAVVAFDPAERRMLDQYRRLRPELRKAVTGLLRRVADDGAVDAAESKQVPCPKDEENSGT